MATFLGGARPATVVQPPHRKEVELEIIVPIEDMTELGQPADDLAGAAAGEPSRMSIWPHVEARVLDLIDAHRSTIVFANSRRLAERLSGRLNELAYERAAEGDEEEAASAEDHAPAEMMAQAGASRGAPADVVRAHHGSVSKEERSTIEEALKAGRLPAVVATSSLELGIDMGAVDLVIQVESPPSVAGGLQRIGRAGHQVGAVSKGVIFPKYRGDLVQTAVVAERMRDGQIEELRYPRNPLDVLAQQIIAMVGMDEWPVDELEALVRRAAPFATLPRSVLEATLDMLAGRYPSDEFGELRPRLVWDRVAGVLRGRPGAQRLAVTSGGTIPDRGLFGVFLVGGRRPHGSASWTRRWCTSRGSATCSCSARARGASRTSRPTGCWSPPRRGGRASCRSGTATLRGGRPSWAVRWGRSAASWRRWSQSGRASAYGRPAWTSGRPATCSPICPSSARPPATSPTTGRCVVERFRDELGDWRLVVHSPYGALVHAPWALAMTARLRERYGVDAQAMHSDDGIVLRIPDTGVEDASAPPASDLALFDPEEIEQIVTDELGGSALFASRFRECAARALLLPRHRRASACRCGSSGSGPRSC